MADLDPKKINAFRAHFLDLVETGEGANEKVIVSIAQCHREECSICPFQWGTPSCNSEATTKHGAGLLAQYRRASRGSKTRKRIALVIADIQILTAQEMRDRQLAREVEEEEVVSIPSIPERSFALPEPISPYPIGVPSVTGSIPATATTSGVGPVDRNDWAARARRFEPIPPRGGLEGLPIAPIPSHMQEVLESLQRRVVVQPSQFVFDAASFENYRLGRWEVPPRVPEDRAVVGETPPVIPESVADGSQSIPIDLPSNAEAYPDDLPDELNWDGEPETDTLGDHQI